MPTDCHADALYLQPLSNPSPTCWYFSTPYGHNRLASSVAGLCKEAGISEYKSNYFLHATWLHNSNNDKQVIMERTSHVSSERVRTYKRTSCSMKSIQISWMEQRDHVSALHLCASTSSCIITMKSVVVSVWVSHQHQHHQQYLASQGSSFILHASFTVTIFCTYASATIESLVVIHGEYVNKFSDTIYKCYV